MNIKIKKSVFNSLYLVACSGWKKKFREKFEDYIFADEIEFEESFLDEMKNACDPSKPEQLETFNKIFKSYIKEDLFSRIKNYSGVCRELGIVELKEKDFKQFEEDSKKMLAFHQIKNIEKLFNQGWQPDFSNSSQYKYYPYFEKVSGGLRFFDSYYRDCYFVCSCGLFKDKKTSDFVGNTFKDIYISLI